MTDFKSHPIFFLYLSPFLFFFPLSLSLPVVGGRQSRTLLSAQASPSSRHCHRTSFGRSRPTRAALTTLPRPFDSTAAPLARYAEIARHALVTRPTPTTKSRARHLINLSFLCASTYSTESSNFGIKIQTDHRRRKRIMWLRKSSVSVGTNNLKCRIKERIFLKLGIK